MVSDDCWMVQVQSKASVNYTFQSSLSFIPKTVPSLFFCSDDTREENASLTLIGWNSSFLRQCFLRVREGGRRIPCKERDISASVGQEKIYSIIPGCVLKGKSVPLVNNWCFCTIIITMKMFKFHLSKRKVKVI